LANTVADQFTETLAAAGVKRVYGIVSDSLNGLTDTFRRQGKIEWVHVRHEEVAAFSGRRGAFDRSARGMRGQCGRAIYTSINRLFDYHRSHVSGLPAAWSPPTNVRMDGPALASPCTDGRAVDDANRGLKRGR
jgi:pyruvate dehydrogenase (quinone)